MIFQGMYLGRKIFNLNARNIDIEHCFYLEKGFEFAIHCVHFYVLYFFVFPRFLSVKFKKQHVLFWIVFLVIIFYFRAFANVLFFNEFGLACNFPSCNSQVVQWLHIANTLIVSGLSAMVFMTINLIKTQKQKIDLITQNRDSELALLRAQINPHFLFNTLNNIYYLANKKSNQAGQAVMRLSEMMRYMINESNSDKVPLEKEIAYIQGFIDLQKLRIKDGNVIDLSINGKVRGLLIAPMLLISFVENAFKYGVQNEVSKGVEIKLDIHFKTLTFKISNYYNPNQHVEGGGFGLKNVKRRLELIYPNTFDLQIEKDVDIRKYLVKLILKLEHEN
jgi:LytS/YehU family sensor histidine kinase